MSLSCSVYLRENGCFPRVSGDEPDSDLANMPLGVFSPRERG